MKYLLGLSAEPITNKIDNRLDGVGMIRSEYLCRSCNEYITTNICQKFVREYVDNICKLFYPDEVWYRTTDFLSPEINILKGTDAFLNEKHYLLGLRGIRRAVKYPQTFILEMKNLSIVANQNSNLNVLFPYIGDPNELAVVLKILRKVKFNGKYGIMAEIPSAILLLDKFAEQGISNITVGINDLTSLTLGTNRGENSNHIHPSIIKLLEMAIETGKKFNIPVAVGGHVSINLESICKNIGIDSFIINYNYLSDILNIPHTNLEHMKLYEKLEDKFI